ncbi:MFS transporter [Nocardioidaceae bacterium]|nr:MFS transporter [Nocardioidaceae bacterium]
MVLLPFSVLGPFVGVFLDRWPRRSVLVWANWARVPVVVVMAFGTYAGWGTGVLLLLALLALSVDRFLLAGLSTALPRVVAPERLVTANSIVPTAGTASFLTGLAAGSTLQVQSGSEALVLGSTAVLYVLAGASALVFPRRRLGPDPDVPRADLRTALVDVVTGLRGALGHLHQRRPAAYALATIGAHRFFYGISTVAVILLYRNYFYAPDQSEQAFAALSVAVLVSGAGFVSAAVLTPVLAGRVGTRDYVAGLLAVATVVVVFPTALYTVPAVLVASFVLGVVSQGVKISVDTTVQLAVADTFRGRVFVLYDVLFNVAFVVAAVVAAAVLPADGVSVPVLVASALGYAAIALVWVRVQPRALNRVAEPS